MFLLLQSHKIPIPKRLSLSYFRQEMEKYIFMYIYMAEEENKNKTPVSMLYQRRFFVFVGAEEKKES